MDIKGNNILKIGAIFLDEDKNTLITQCSIFYILVPDFNTDNFNHIKNDSKYSYLFINPTQKTINFIENRKTHPEGTNIDAPRFLCWVLFKDTIVPENIVLNYPTKTIQDGKVFVDDLCSCNINFIKVDKFLL